MITTPRVDVYFEDGNLGLTVPSGASLQLKVGTAQSGDLGVPTVLSRLTDLRDTFGAGPLASAMAVAMSESKPVMGLRVSASVAGTVSAVVKTGTGTSVATVAGSPVDAADVTVTITRDATSLVAATAAYRVSVNGTELGERALPSSGIVEIAGTGLTATFAEGTFKVGDTYSVTATAPGTTLADIASAIEAFLNGAYQPVRFIHVLGGADPALAAAINSLLMEAETRGKYTHALLEAKPRNAGESVAAYRARVETEWQNFTSTRVSVALEGGQVYNPLSKRFETRSAAWLVSMRRTRVPVGEDASRVRTGSLTNAGTPTVTLAGGEATRFVALCTHDGKEGVYCAGWPTMAPTGSDYDLIQQREVADEAARAGRIAAFDYLGDDVPVDPNTGKIMETSASAIEAYIEGRVRAQIGANVSGVRVHVDRDINILSTRHMEYDIVLLGLGYFRSITVRVGYTNPMLQNQSAPTPTMTGAALPASGGNA